MTSPWQAFADTLRNFWRIQEGTPAASGAAQGKKDGDGRAPPSGASWEFGLNPAKTPGQNFGGRCSVSAASWPGKKDGGDKSAALQLDVKIHIEFVRMRPEAKFVVLFGLHRDPVLDEVLVEHITFQEELMVGL